jgi:outer membrane protein W
VRLLRLFRALAAIVALLPSGARAQSYSDPGTGLGARAGVADGRSASGASLDGGLFFRYRLTASLGLEGSVGYRRETVDDGEGPLLDLLEVPVMGTGQLFFFPRSRIQPFLLAGAGLHVVKTVPKGRNVTTDAGTEAQFGVHVGAGLDLRTTRATAVTLDARWVFVEPTAFADLSAAGYDVRSGYGVVTVGIAVFR